MAERQRTSLPLLPRWGILIGIFAVALGILFWRRHELLLAYRLNAAAESIRRRDFQPAIDLLQRSEERGQHNPTWQYLSARAKRRAGNAAGALEHLDQAERLGASAADIERQRLLARAQSGDIKQVESDLGRLLGEDASDDEAEELYEAMARGYLASYHLADALKALKFWIEFQPDNPIPQVWLGDLYVRMEDSAAARQAYSKALELSPERQDARLKLAQEQLINLDVEEAEKNFEQCVKQSPDSGEALLGLADCRRRQGASEDAASLLREALIMDLTPSQIATALTILGRIDIEEGRASQAISTLEQSIALDAFDPTSRLALASALAARGENEAAAHERDTALALSDRRKRLVELTRRATTEPRNADLRAEAGRLLIQLGRPAAGAEWLKTAIAISPRHEAAHRDLAAYYKGVGDSQAAASHQAAAGPPDTPRADGPQAAP
jgi:tetratricopeptide (TPR) repeat protein